MAGISAANRALARHYASTFGVGRPSVRRWWNDDETVGVDLLSAPDVPQEGLTSYGTIGVSDHTPSGRPATEFVAVCESGREAFDQALSTLALHATERRWRCGPGSVLEDALMAAASSTLRHLMRISPMLWEDDAFQTVTFEGKAVSFLQALPISRAELAYAKVHGPDALQDRIVEARIDVFDLDRQSLSL